MPRVAYIKVNEALRNEKKLSCHDETCAGRTGEEKRKRVSN